MKCNQNNLHYAWHSWHAQLLPYDNTGQIKLTALLRTSEGYTKTGLETNSEIPTN